MPNWTANNVLFVGKRKQLETLKDMLKSKDNDFDFNNIVPMPKNIFRGNLGKEEEEKYGDNNWYRWSIDNWGTKWNACDVYIHEKQEDYFHVGFSTAWSPPIPVIDALMEQHPNLNVEIEYSESGMGFAGTFGRQDGHYFDNEGEIINLSSCCRQEMTDEWYEECDEQELDAWDVCPKCKEECEFNEEIRYKQ